MTEDLDFEPIPPRERNYPAQKYRLFNRGKAPLGNHEKTELDRDFNLDLGNCYAIVVVTREEFKRWRNWRPKP